MVTLDNLVEPIKGLEKIRIDVEKDKLSLYLNLDEGINKHMEFPLGVITPFEEEFRFFLKGYNDKLRDMYNKIINNKENKKIGGKGLYNFYCEKMGRIITLFNYTLIDKNNLILRGLKE